MIEQRLQDKLRKETDSVRRAEEAKKDKTTANRKEEELQLKDSIVRIHSYHVFLIPTPSPHIYLARHGDADANCSLIPIAKTETYTTAPSVEFPAHVRCHSLRRL